MDRHEQSEETIATEDEAVDARGGGLSDQEALEASSEHSERRWHRLHQTTVTGSSAAAVTSPVMKISRALAPSGMAHSSHVRNSTSWWRQRCGACCWAMRSYDSYGWEDIRATVGRSWRGSSAAWTGLIGGRTSSSTSQPTWPHNADPADAAALHAS